MTELKTLVPIGMINDSFQEYPRASLRLVVLTAVGGINRTHPWYEHAIRIAVHVSRCIFPALPQTPDGAVVSVPLTLLMLKEMGVLVDIETFKEGFAVYQNERWLDWRRARLMDPQQDLALTHFDAEVAIWSPAPQTENDEA